MHRKPQKCSCWETTRISCNDKRQRDGVAGSRVSSTEQNVVRRMRIPASGCRPRLHSRERSLGQLGGSPRRADAGSGGARTSQAWEACGRGVRTSFVPPPVPSLAALFRRPPSIPFFWTEFNYFSHPLLFRLLSFITLILYTSWRVVPAQYNHGLTRRARTQADLPAIYQNRPSRVKGRMTPCEINFTCGAILPAPKQHHPFHGLRNPAGRACRPLRPSRL